MTKHTKKDTRMSRVQKAVDAIREMMHSQCKDMPPEEYQEVLETLQGDIEGGLEAIKEEAET